MKVKKLILLLFLLTINTIAQNKQIEVLYSLKLNNDNKTDLVYAFESQKFSLTVSKNESLFKSVQKMDTQNDKNNYLARQYSGANDTFYTDILNKTSIQQKQAFGDFFLINISDNSTNWKIYKESKQISGYTCFKATQTFNKINYKGEKTETNVIAWYCPDINISSGPLGYFGLPGLILELQTAKIIYYATNIKTNVINSLKIEKPSKGKMISQKEFDEIGKEMFDNRREKN